MKNIITLILLALLGSSCEPAHGQLQVGDKLPENRMEELKNMSSSDFPVPAKPAQLYLIDFWSIWCGSCIAGFPKVEGLQYRYRDEIRILAINPWNDDKAVLEFFEKQRRMREPADEKKKSDAVKKPSDGPLEVIAYVPSISTPKMTSLPASNGDESWFDLFEIKGVPHYIWIDANGQILAITGPHEVHAGNINHYLMNKTLPEMTFKSPSGSYNLSKQSLTEAWGSDVFPYQEDGLKIRDFYNGDGGSAFGYDKLGVVDSVKNTIRYSFVNTPVADLYKAAWEIGSNEHHRPEYRFGKPFIHNGDTLMYSDVLSERLLWDVSQPEYYLGPLDGDYVSAYAPGFNEWSFRAKFCAELELPLERQEEASRILLEGLNRYLSQKLGISGRIESMKRPCLVLKKQSDFQPFTTNMEKASMEYDQAEQVERYHNLPFNNIFLDYLPYRISYGNRKYWDTNSRGRHYMPRLNRNLPLIDETGITRNVDLVLHAVPDKVKDPLKALNMRLEGTGLYFEKEMREIKMLVISDRDNGSTKAW